MRSQDPPPVRALAAMAHGSILGRAGLINARTLLAKLEGPCGGSSRAARCPAHDDESPSLSIKESKNGLILWRSHAGCGAEEATTALRGHGSLEDDAVRSGQRSRGRQFSTTFDYLNHLRRCQVLHVQGGLTVAGKFLAPFLAIDLGVEKNHYVPCEHGPLRPWFSRGKR